MRGTWLLAGTAAGMAGIVGYGVKGRSANVFGPSVFCGPGQRRSIALTFDDGPSPGSLELIDYLAQQNVPATFFQCGMNVLRHPGIARIIAEAGHEIGNHTFSHPRLCPRLGWKLNLHSPRFVDGEFAMAQKVIKSETGVMPRLLRAPYGMRWFGMNAVQERLGLLGVMWTVIGHDWEWPAHRVATLVSESACPGGIVCLHDGRDVRPTPDIAETLLAVRHLVPRLRGLGYSFETVSCLLMPDASHVTSAQRQ